jgi:hypothetical protein
MHLSSNFLLGPSQKHVDTGAIWGDDRLNHRPILPRVPPMSRLKKQSAYVQQKVSFDAVVMARFQRIHWDPVLGKAKYGAVSQVLNKALLDYVNKVESGQESPLPILTDAEQTL